jgi:hypothetical protein
MNQTGGSFRITIGSAMDYDLSAKLRITGKQQYLRLDDLRLQNERFCDLRLFKTLIVDRQSYNSIVTLRSSNRKSKPVPSTTKLNFSSFRVLLFPDEADRHNGMNFPAGIGFHFFLGDAVLFSPWLCIHMESIEKKLPRDPDIRSRGAIIPETSFLLTFKDISIKKITDIAAGILQRLIPCDERGVGRFYDETGISPF